MISFLLLGDDVVLLVFCSHELQCALQLLTARMKVSPFKSEVMVLHGKNKKLLQIRNETLTQKEEFNSVFGRMVLGTDRQIRALSAEN